MGQDETFQILSFGGRVGTGYTTVPSPPIPLYNYECNPVLWQLKLKEAPIDSSHMTFKISQYKLTYCALRYLPPRNAQ